MSALPPQEHRLHFVSFPSARDLCITTPDVSPSTDNATVLQLFSRHKDLVSLPVVEDGRPFGLINRHSFLSQMARPYYRELYDRKSCIAFMDKTPLIVEASASLSDVADKAVISGERFLADGFIITENSRYLGIGLGIDLFRIVSDTHVRQHQQIVQSIEYASVIQGAMLTPFRQTLEDTLQDWCLVWEPRDCVGGDCYAFRRYEQGWLAVLTDCTGHGVPGAFMTLIFNSALEQALAQHRPDQTGQLLGSINRYIKDTLGQKSGYPGQMSASDDGCDALVVYVNTTEQTLNWASARMTAFVTDAQSGDLLTLDSDRMGVGYTNTPYDYSWPAFQRPLSSQDLFFAATDGLLDQIGGERQIKFGKRRLQNLLQRLGELPMSQLATQLLQHHRAWQGTQARRDDLTFWGFRHHEHA
ncbi:SpoIIE family protein phosphatase [Dickeya zeae]|uniref:SpoIIE family protein phosphatase n=1 Tax=Dickeya zeae TaxID=204042 RepID=UPI000C9B670A|nr:SpoIIE family protein phosphatase [Dickeya zeae]AUQ24511.1 protein-serine/threonine phosphatase [Dickeya zeae]UJR57617.1 SpoIIE family protein phosphatase [Dickeya zeae]